MTNSPSPFYDQFTGSRKYTLLYPLSVSGDGPAWHPGGELVIPEEPEWEEEEIEAVHLGGNRYLLAEKCMTPFTLLTLQWGEIFHAKETEDGMLELLKVETPLRYHHETSIGSGRFSNDYELATVIHRLNGGWECAAGILTISIPVERLDEYEAWDKSRGRRASKA